MALFEGAGQNLVSREELVADFSQGPQGLAQANLGVDSIVDDLHGGGAVGPLVGGVKEVGLPRDHVDRLVRLGLPQLPEHGFLDVAGDLRLAPGVVLSGQSQFQGCHRQVIVSLVRVSVPTPAPNNHGHVGQPFRVLVLKERFPQFGQTVLPVGLQGPHKLPRAPPRQDVIRGTVSNQRLALVELATGRAAAGDAVIELPGPGELTVRAGQEHGLQAVVPQGQELRALC